MQRAPWSAVPARRAVGVIGALVVMVLFAACGSEAPTTELADDPADITVPGPRPTAPPPDADRGLSASGDELIVQLEELSNESDLCRVLTGEAFEQLLSEEFDVAGLVTSPAGVTQLFALFDTTFARLVAISPPEVRPAMVTIDEVWSRAAASAGAADAQRRNAELLAEPQVVEATRSLVTWAAFNCPGAAATLGGVAGP